MIKVTDIKDFYIRPYTKHYGQTNQAGNPHLWAGREYCVVRHNNINYHCSDMDLYDIYHHYPEDFDYVILNDTGFKAVSSVGHTNEMLKNERKKSYDPKVVATRAFKFGFLYRACTLLYCLGLIDSYLNNQMAADYLGINWDGVDQRF